MNFKKTLFGGITILVISISIGIHGILWGIGSSFDSSRTNQTAFISIVYSHLQ